jgi:hypothetical protein
MNESDHGIAEQESIFAVVETPCHFNAVQRDKKGSNKSMTATMGQSLAA